MWPAGQVGKWDITLRSIPTESSKGPRDFSKEEVDSDTQSKKWNSKKCLILDRDCF